MYVCVCVCVCAHKPPATYKQLLQIVKSNEIMRGLHFQGPAPLQVYESICHIPTLKLDGSAAVCQQPWVNATNAEKTKINKLKIEYYLCVLTNRKFCKIKFNINAAIAPEASWHPLQVLNEWTVSTFISTQQRLSLYCHSCRRRLAIEGNFNKIKWNKETCAESAFYDGREVCGAGGYVLGK